MTKLKYIRTSSREEWLTERRKMSGQGMIGGSDAGTIMGLNNYKSRVKLFYQAVGYEPMTDVDNEIMFHGRNLEDYVANLWQYYDGNTESMLANHASKTKVRKARRLNAMVVNPKYPWLFANIDRVITSHPEQLGKGILEIKTISSYHAEMWASGVPPAYIIQIQHYLIVMGYKYAELAILSDGRKFESIPFPQHESIQDKILDVTYDFNQRVLQGLEIMKLGLNDEDTIQALSQIQPEPESTEAFSDYMSERHKRRLNEKTIPTSMDVLDAAKNYSQVMKDAKELEKEKLRVVGIIKNYMESHSASVVDMGDNGTITWRKQLNINFKENINAEANIDF
jgi:predicted phage-related endonuclease